MSLIPHYFNTNLFFNFIKSSELALIYINFFIALIYEKKESLFDVFDSSLLSIHIHMFSSSKDFE